MVLGKRIDIIIVKIAVIASVLSQISEIESIFRPLMYFSWILLMLYLLFVRKFKLSLSRFTQHFVFAYFLFVLICVLGSFLGMEHLDNNYLKILRIPILITIIGELMKNDIDADEMVSIFRVFILSALFFAIWIHLTYFRSLSAWMDSNIYLFEQKNSAAQIWSMAVLLLIFQNVKYNKKQALIRVFIIFYLVLILGLSQCRTALLGIGCALFFVYLKKLKHPIITAFCVLAVCFALYMIPDIKQTIDHMFLLDKYSGSDLNTMSSGRLEGIKMSLEYFMTSPLLGVGKWYIDCSYVSVLTESGIIGFILIESIWFYRVILNMTNKSKIYGLLLQATTIFYLVESLLEGYPPFGPGVSSFMFWFICCVGYSSCKLRKNEKLCQD